MEAVEDERSQVAVEYTRGITVVVPTYNRPLATRVCVDCLRMTQTPVSEYEIIIVDDNSSDDTKRLLGDTYRNCPNISIVQTKRTHERQRSPAYPKNVGIRQARHQYIACCDSDVLHFTDPIARTIAWLDRHPDRYIVSGLWAQIDGPPDKPALNFRQQRAMPFGAWIAMSWKHWFALGAFDERFQYGSGEDADLARRLTMREMTALPDTRIIAVEVKRERSTRASHDDHEWETFRGDTTMRRNVNGPWGGME